MGADPGRWKSRPIDYDLMETEMNETTTRELAARTSDGIDVALLWYTGTNRLEVRVEDSCTGELFALDVDHHDALDVFEHPYAYAAFRGVDYAAREPVHA
jgi:hypothetical protein